MKIQLCTHFMEGILRLAPTVFQNVSAGPKGLVTLLLEDPEFSFKRNVGFSIFILNSDFILDQIMNIMNICLYNEYPLKSLGLTHYFNMLFMAFICCLYIKNFL